MALAFVVALGTAPAQDTAYRDDPSPPAGELDAALQRADDLRSSNPAEALAIARHVRGQITDSTPPEVVAWQRNLEGWAQWKLGELEAATALAVEAEALARGAGHRGTLSEAIQLRGLVKIDNSEFEAALKTFGEGLALAREMGSDRAIGQSFNNLGIVLRRLGRLEEAVEAYSQALLYRRRLDDPAQVAQTLNNLGVTLNYLGDYPQALAVHAESLDIKREMGKDEEVSDSLYNLAAVYEQMGALEDALTFYRESYEYDVRSGQKRNMALGRNKLSLLELKLGRVEAAREHAEQALAMFRELGRGQGAANTLIVLGQIALVEGRPRDAEARFVEAQAMGDENGERNIAAIARMRRAEALLALGDIESGLSLGEEAVSALESIGLKAELREGLGLLARLHERAGQLSKALQRQRESEAIGKQLLDEQQLRQLGAIRRSSELREREREIERLELQSAAQARQVERATLTRNFWLAASAGVFLLLFLLASRYWHRRQLAEERKVNQSLQRLDALKDEFLANTSHELRTPLMGIQGLAESMLVDHDRSLGDKDRQNLQMIVASGSRLGTLVDDILDFSRLRRDQLRLECVSVNLHAATELVLALTTPLLRGKEVALINAVPRDLPTVSADENRLQQILHNLVGNACKFTERGRIVIEARVEGQRVAVEVRDTGVGIPESQQQSIFEPFEQGDGSLTRAYGGTGLGLAVSRRLVELHGGALTVQSAPGQGSVFRFDLALSGSPAAPAGTQRRRSAPEEAEPVAADQASTSPAMREQALMPPASRNGERFRILVVDDEPVNRQVLANFLSEFYTVREAGSGQEALDQIKEAPADLLILDLMMPGLSGYEVCRQLRAMTPLQEFPVIMLTASHRLSDLVQGFHLGANDYLTKPVSRGELLSRVATHLRLLDISRHLEQRVAERTAELERATELLRRASETDFLTGLPNRRGLLMQLSQVTSAQTRAVLLLDIDNFKHINDTYGHEGGDVVLKDVADTLREVDEDTGSMARWGGEEFIVVMHDVPPEAAQAQGERLRAALSTRRIHVGSRVLQATATIGVSSGLCDEPFDALVKRADQALYRGKAAGKNQVVSASS